MEKQEEKNQPATPVQVEIRPGGPLVISGTFTLIDEQGKEHTDRNRMAICRCGLSQKQPFCDGSHKGQSL